MSLLGAPTGGGRGRRARSGCGANGGHGPRDDADRTRDAGATTPRSDPGRAAENTTPPIADRSGGPPIRPPDAGLSPPRRTAVRRSSGPGTRASGPRSSGRRTARPSAGTGARAAPARCRPGRGRRRGPSAASERYRSRSKTAATIRIRPGRMRNRIETTLPAGPAAATTRPTTTRTTPSPPISPRASVTPMPLLGALGRAGVRGDDHGGAVGHDLGHGAGRARRSRSASR